MKEQHIEDVLGQVGTPAYLYDLDLVRERAAEVRMMLGDHIDLCYAMKANPFLTSTFEPLVERIECCSMGEYRIAREQKIPAHKLYISGVLKIEADIREIAEDVGAECVYSAESAGQLRLLAKIAEEKNLTLRVIPRLTSGNQFGMSPEDLKAQFTAFQGSKYIRLIGLHYFSGTQKTGKQVMKELVKLKGIVEELQEEGMTLSELEYGPGYPISYFEGDKPRITKEEIKEEAEAALQIPVEQVTFEMGRFFAAPAGVYCTKILDMKESNDRIYCITDGGMHHLQYDGQIRGMYTPEHTVLSEYPEGEEAVYTICGSLCTGNDILCNKLTAKTLHNGDVLVFENAGAYSAFEGMALFLSHDLPAIVLHDEQDGIRIARSAIPAWKLNTYGGFTHE